MIGEALTGARCALASPSMLSNSSNSSPATLKVK
jgi:hypothetical protein